MEARYLAARSEMGYVDTPALALPGEPEAVSEEEQMALTEQAQQKALDVRIKRRVATSEEIERELVHLEGRCKYLRRQLKRLQR
jgi:predicted phage-related endonuclease